MIGGFGAPGQRETIKGGRDQDLLTPFWQTLALLACGPWCLMWLVFWGLVVGPVLGYVIALTVLLVRCRRLTKKYTAIPWQWIAWNLVIHVGVAFALDRIWTPYLLTWSLWNKVIWSVLCALMIAPAAWFYYHTTIRTADPNYPSPRKAVDQRQPQMPWYRDQPVAQPTELIPRLVRTQVESSDPNYHAGMLDLPPVREWYAFALWVLRNPGDLTETKAKSFKVKLSLKGDKPPWYGRGFRQVRSDILARQWGHWVDESNHGQGFVLLPEALASFRAFCEDGPPTTPLPGG